MRNALVAALCLSCAICVFAQSPLTTISGTLPGVNGVPPSGTATISWQRSMNDATPRQIIYPGSTTITITNGVVNTQLFPNAAMLPISTCYGISYRLNGVNSQRYWYVPISSTPVNLNQVEGNIPCPVQQGVIVAPGQITPGAPGQTQVLTSSPTGTVSWTTGGGGGGSSLFSQILTGINNTAQTLTVGPTSALTFIAGGVVNANQLLGTAITSLYGTSGQLTAGSGTFTNQDLASFDANSNIVDSAIPKANVVLSNGTYPDPPWLTSLSSSKLSGLLPCAIQPAFTGDVAKSASSCATVVTTTNGVAFAPSATVDTTQATNITSGVFVSARIPAINLAASGVGGVTGNLPAGNLNSGVNADASHFLRGDMTWQLVGAGGTVTNSAGPLTAGQLVIGNNGVDETVLGTLGTATTVLHGNVTGNPGFSAVVLTTDVSGILPSANGGTANAFFTVAGPATSAKTFTFPNASSTVLTSNAAVTMVQGGTGADQSAIAKGGLLSGTGAGTLGITVVGTNGQILSADSGSAGGIKWIAAGVSGTVTSIACTAPVVCTPSPITATGTLTAPTVVTSAAALVLNQLVIGGGLQASSTLGSLGTTTQVLHGNGAGAPSFGAIVNADITNATIDVTAKITGAVPIANGGTNAVTAAAALINLFPTATRAGDVIYCATFAAGACTSWGLLAGNNSGTQFLSETSSGVPSWGAAGVSSVFTRTGAVVATSGDYTAAQVTNAVANNAANTYTGGGLQSMSAVDLLLPNHASDPGTCTVGQIEFNTTGAVSKICSTTNTWTGLAGGTPTFQLSGGGSIVSGTLNFIPGTGVGLALANVGGVATLTPSFNSAIIATHDTVHAGESYPVLTSSGTTAYTATMPYKALPNYTIGMSVVFEPDVTCSSSCTLGIDGLATPPSIKKADGATDPAGALIAHQPQLLTLGPRTCTIGTTCVWLLPGNSAQIYPAAGVAVSTGSAWGTSLTAPTGALVGISDTQTLTNKSISGSEINSGLVALTYGGTNANLSGSNGGIFYSTASAGAILAGTATANQVLLSGASAAPSWSTATYPATTTINQVLYSSAANTVAGLATVNSGVLITSGAGVPSISTTLPANLTFVTPVLGAATATSLLASGIFDGQAPVTITTGASATLGGTYNSGYTLNQNATAATAIIYTLPTAAAGKQYCVANSYNGTAANTGTLEILTSAAGQFIIFTDGTLSATGGYVISSGLAGDFACVIGVDATHWQFRPAQGAWTKH